MVSSQAASFDASKSIFALSKPPYLAGNVFAGIVRACDNLGCPWIEAGIAPRFQVSINLGTTFNVILLIDNGNGTASFEYKLTTVATCQLSVVDANDSQINATGSPYDLKVAAGPALASLRSYGPILESSAVLPYFNVIPYDQYDNILPASQLWDPSELYVASSYAKMGNPLIQRYGRGYRVTNVKDAAPEFKPIPPVVRVSKQGLDFSPGPYLIGATSTATRPLVTWQNHNKNQTSSFVVTATHSDGSRRFTGGDIVSVGTQQNSSYVILSVQDWGDGSYLAEYIPLSDDKIQIPVSVNGLSAFGSPFNLPADSQWQIVLSGNGLTHAVTGVTSSIHVQTLCNNQGMPAHFVFTGLVYSVNTRTAVTATIDFSSPTSDGTITASYILDSNLFQAGSYRLQVWRNFQQFESNTTDLAVSEPQPGTIFDIDGLDWTGPCSDVYRTPEIFIITPVPAVTCQPSDLDIVCSPAENTAFQKSAYGQGNLQLAVNFGVAAVGTYTLSLNFQGLPVKRRNSSTNTWTITAYDNMRSLTRYVIGQPSDQWYTSQEGSGPPGAIVLDSGNLQLATQSPTNALSRAEGGWKIPGFTAPFAGFGFGFRVAVTQFDVGAESLSFFGPLIRANDGTYPALRKTNGQNPQWTRMGGSGQASDVFPSVVRADGQWHYLLVQVNLYGLRLFEDSRLVVNTPLGPNYQFANPLPFNAGFATDTGTNAFNSQMKEFFTCPSAMRGFMQSSTQGESFFNIASMKEQGTTWTIDTSFTDMNWSYGGSSLTVSSDKTTHSRSVVAFQFLKYEKPHTVMLTLLSVGQEHYLYVEMVNQPKQPMTAVQLLFKIDQYFEGTTLFGMHGGVGLEVIKPVDGGVISYDYYHYGKDDKGEDTKLHLQ